jgi:hypothetical protein
MTLTRAPFYSLYAKPRSIESVEPPFGPLAGGTVIVIRGRKLAPVGNVIIGTQLATGLGNIDDDAITCTTPAGQSPGPKTVWVVTIGIGGAVTKPSGFTYGDVVPSLESITPNHGPRTGGTPVEIKGNWIGGASGVRFGFADAPAPVTVDDETIQTVTPASIGLITIPHTVFVDFDDGRATLQNLLFTYEPVE